MVTIFAPSSFDPHDETLHATRRENATWESGANMLRLCSPKAVISIVPDFWQMQPLIEEACAGIAPLFVCQPENLPLAEAAIRAGIDTVILAGRDSFALSSRCASGGVFPRSWIIIYAEGEALELPAPLRENKEFFVVQEIQSAPGITVRSARL